ncbi:MAG: YHYH protein [Alphaproteobacteria bacterium]|jgi:hypothetical protein|nr:YHYH protein [Alphaproteobacteria bacterium]
MNRRTYVFLAATLCAVSVGGSNARAAGATDPETIAVLQNSPRLGVELKRGQNSLSVTTPGTPSHKTGTFPMMGDSDGDGRADNPNSIQARRCTYSIPLKPRKASRPGKLGRGPIAISITGTFFFSKETHLGGDAVTSEVFDQCQGHPDQQGTYHYHQYSSCMGERAEADGHAGLIGWSPDGYGIYGWGGRTLDRCNGHTDGGRGYHYHTTKTSPYVLGCYAGEVASARPRCDGGGSQRNSAQGNQGGSQSGSRRRPPPFGKPPPFGRPPPRR